MLGSIFNFSDPRKFSYYIPIFFGIGLIFLILEIILKNRKRQYENGDNSQNNSLDMDKSYPSELIYRKRSLKHRYLVSYIISRIAIWAKSPYLYILLMTLQKFSFQEIGLLYIIGLLSSIIFGSISTVLSDHYGCKLCCLFYKIFSIVRILLLIYGNHKLVYISQIISGINEADTKTSEAWVDSEFKKEFEDYPKEREKSRLNLLKKTKVYDGIASIITIFIIAFIYPYFGIRSPFWISIIFNGISFFYIILYWNENMIYLHHESYFTRIYEALKELKKVNVLCIGLIESLIMACLYIFIFSWTPILKLSIQGGMNVGFIFLCIACTMIIGNKLYEIIIACLNSNYYMSITLGIFLQGVLLYLTYYIDSFLARLIFLSLFNGLFGLYNPVNSIIKNQIIVEKNVGIITNLFNIIAYVFYLVILLNLKFMTPFTLALISGSMAFLAFIIALFLVIYLTFIEPREEINVRQNIVQIE